MKRKNIYLGLCLLVGSATITGCNKYLSVAPDNRTELNTVEKIREVLGTAYPQGNWIPVAEAMSDNATDKGEGRGSVYFDLEQAYLYLDNSDVDQDTPNFFWNESYGAINSANQALDAISKMPNPDNLKSEKAEALLCRAYAHFMLVTLYAKPYNEATSSTDMGVPYVTEVEKVLKKQYTRQSVKEVYDRIEKDLQEALPNIDDSRYKVPKYHFTRSSANAFASRFYLHKKDYQKVVECANQVLPANFDGSALRPWLTLFKGTSNDIRINYTKASLQSNLLLVESGSFWARMYYTTRFGLTNALSDGDATMKGVTPSNNVVGNSSWAYRTFISGQDNPFYPKWSEYFYTPNDPRFGFPYVMIPLFTLEEVLFNRAEANTYLGNYANAIADLNIFAKQRFNNYNSSNHTLTTDKVTAFYKQNEEQSIIQAILDFRRAEFMHEGMRWLDILRYDLPVKHFVKNRNQVIVSTIELPAGDLRRQWQLPEQVVSAGVELNAR